MLSYNFWSSQWKKKSSFCCAFFKYFSRLFWTQDLQIHRKCTYFAIVLLTGLKWDIYRHLSHDLENMTKITFLCIIMFFTSLSLKKAVTNICSIRKIWTKWSCPFITLFIEAKKQSRRLILSPFPLSSIHRYFKRYLRNIQSQQRN